MTADVLAVGAHPDDVELGVGGLIHKLTSCSLSVAIVDLTEGEMSTRGSVEERRQEAARAAEILGAAYRENVGLPDGQLANTTGQQRRLIPFIRRYRPKLILGPMNDDRHPDHTAAHRLVRDANFFAGLARIETGQEPHRTPSVYFYHPYHNGAALPALVVDVSDHFEAKLEALRTYRSQFYNPDYHAPETHISSEAFWKYIHTRAAYWGNRVGAAFGEPLYADGPVGVRLPPGLRDTR